MSIFIEGNTYLDTQEVLSEIKVSKPVFYKNIRPLLQVHHFAGRRKPYYKKADVQALKSGKPTRKANIVISGILADWTVYLRSLGFHAETIVRTLETVTLPQDAIEAFRLSPEQQFVRRSKMTLADGQPICAWDTYYPLDLVRGAIYEAMKADFAFDVVKSIKAVHGVVVEVARDRYTARLASLAEQELLQLRTNEPILQLQRASYTRGKNRLVLYSDMALLGSWFSPEMEYPVNVW
jgi:UTRA domain